MRGPVRFFLILGITALLPGCLTQANRLGLLLEGNRAGGDMVLRCEDFPVLRLRASRPGADGGFQLRSLEYLGGNPLGWVEFSLELSGEGEVTPGGLPRLGASPEARAIRGGKIRRMDTRLSGEEAQRALEDRYGRIKALAEWMRGEIPPSPGLTYRDFQSRWRPLLFPKSPPRAERPPGYGALPEELRSLWDSGVLKRDWEECGEWVFLVYAWKNIFAAPESGGLILRSE